MKQAGLRPLGSKGAGPCVASAQISPFAADSLRPVPLQARIASSSSTSTHVLAGWPTFEHRLASASEHANGLST